MTCIRCLEERPIQELDRLLWCEECLTLARRRAAVRGWTAGGGLAAVLALYIWLWIQPDFSLIPTAWVATLAVAFYLGGRLSREVLFGWERLRNRRAAEASPPDPQFEPDEEEEPGRPWD